MKKIFISYSWDGEEHQQWVKHLADQIEQYEEFHVILDQYDLDATTDKNYFMEKGVFESDIIIVVCTENYAKKADSRKGGVGIETFMTTIKHWEENEKHGASKIIAITRGDREKSVPRYLKGKFAIQFDDDFDRNLKELLTQLKKEITPQQNRPVKTKSIKKEPVFIYDFNRVDDILALLYKNRKKIDDDKDYSGNQRIRYEFWEVQHVTEKTFFLILFNNVNINQTIERFIKNNKFIPNKIAVIRIDKGKIGYIESIFATKHKQVKIEEFKIDDLVWDACIDQEWKSENNVLEERFFIDQRIYSSNIDAQASLGLSLEYIYDYFLTHKIPVLMLFASGGVGKSTLCSSLNNKINENDHKKAILIQSEDIRENINKEVSKNYRIENLYQLYEIYMRLASSTKSVLNEKQFDLGVLSGRIILIIDGLDEILSLFQDNFDLTKFLDSLMLLNQQMGNSKVIITSRLNVLTNYPSIGERDDVEITYLKGFEEDIWKKYLEQRFHSKLDSRQLIFNVEKVLKGLSLDHEQDNVLPFFLDLICEIVEEEGSNDFIIDTVSKDYISNNENIDYLIHAILKREITRQKFDLPLENLVAFFKELSVAYGDRFTHDNLKYLISIYLDTGDQEEIYQKVLLNPLLTNSGDEKVIKFKYDFLSNYFIVLYLLEELSRDYSSLQISKDLIAQLAKLYDGTHVIFGELVKYFQKKPQKCLKNCNDIVKHLIKIIKKADENLIPCKRAISGVLYLIQKIFGDNLSKDKRREVLDQFYNNQKIEHMYIWGEYYPMDFSNLELWFSEFYKYENFCKSTFINTKFYHTSFYAIPTENKCTDLSTCTFDSCVLGELSTIINAQVEASLGKQKNIEEDLKKFIRNFIDRGNFIYKNFDNITIPSTFASKPKRFVDSMTGTLLEQEEVKLNKSYGIAKEFQKDAISLIKDNHLTPKLKRVVDTLIS